MGICTEMDVMGTSSQSWERAASAAVQAAVASFGERCLIRRADANGLPKPTFQATIVSFDMEVSDDGQITQYRAKVKITFMQTAQSSKFSHAPYSGTR
jgi:flavin-binding protein dodecin